MGRPGNDIDGFCRSHLDPTQRMLTPARRCRDPPDLDTYLREQCSTTRTAERLFTHRNTVLRRLTPADDLLPRPLADNVTAVAAAPEVIRWRG
ncbi:helix-turn-helix domain-containing protein [Streptomyces sp. ME18-1-4]|uniref:helix-turn-helix domain-containing protein n=1 Tax=Streptomyces sp. ME18-1-4 TaxID=3028685 RepID=UPI0029B83A82|nr:helix-turn-helix domain-containing protein [Streptomyces sp. ME18-1-4]MDX3245311.1 helix-turn-helix domain-containing protein [Streptomyces sp. ME18-1-4]